jgi:hypothetical protein
MTDQKGTARFVITPLKKSREFIIEDCGNLAVLHRKKSRHLITRGGAQD